MNNATTKCGFQASRRNGLRANQAGFSLSEFTGVMAVVALLFTMSAPNFLKAHKSSQTNALGKDDPAQSQTYILKVVNDPAALSDDVSDGAEPGIASASKRAFAWIAVAPSDEPWLGDSEQNTAKTGSDTSGVSAALAGARPFRQGLDPFDPRVRDVRSRSGGFVSALTK